MTKKLKSPYFVSAELLKDGTVKLVDDDGEIFHVEMHRDQEWPMLSSQIRNREMRAVGEKIRNEKPPSPPKPFKPRVVK